MTTIGRARARSRAAAMTSPPHPRGIRRSVTTRSIGVEVRVLKAEENFPDCVFVEDPAIVIEGGLVS